MTIRHKQIQDSERAKSILREIDDRIINLQLLKGGLIMSNKTFRTMLNEHPPIAEEFHILAHRRDCLKRFIWLNA